MGDTLVATGKKPAFGRDAAWTRCLPTGWVRTQAWSRRSRSGARWLPFRQSQVSIGVRRTLPLMQHPRRLRGDGRGEGGSEDRVSGHETR